MTDRLHWIEAGSPSLPVVVLLHGFAGSAAVWSDIIDQIKHRAHVLAFDLPGHAGSLTYPNFGSPRAAALALAQEMQLRGIEKYHLVGHSMGGAISVLIALQEPQKIASLTLLAPGGFGAEINGDIMQAFATAASYEELHDSYRMMSGRFTDAVQHAASSAAAMRAHRGQLEALAHVLSKIMRDSTQGQLPLDELAALQIPTHLLWGEQDQVVPVEQARSAPHQFRKTFLPDTGHMLIEEAPDTVVRAILDQL